MCIKGEKRGETKPLEIMEHKLGLHVKRATPQRGFKATKSTQRLQDKKNDSALSITHTVLCWSLDQISG